LKGEKYPMCAITKSSIKDTSSLGSGRFVNRYPVFDLDPFDTGDELTGYCCYECELEMEKEFK
jgi:hypothetical protein